VIVQPAYPSVPVSRVCALPMAQPNPQCELCSLSQQTHKSTCIPADGEPGGLLVVGKGPGVDEDRSGRPDVGRSGRYLRGQIKRFWQGPVAFENAVKCLLPAELSHKCIDACRVFLAGTVAAVQPTRVIALGAEAVYALLGRTVAPLSVRWGYGWMVGATGQFPASMNSVVVSSASGSCKPLLGACVPVFFVLHPAAALRNRFIAQMFEADLEWALKAPPPFTPPWDVQAHVVENEADALEAVAALRASKWFAFDVETAGRMYDSSFTMLSVACTPVGSRMAYVWCREALTDPVVRAPLLAMLSDPKAPKCGQNVKFDEAAVWCAYGVQVRGVVFDTLLQRKLLDPDASGKLEVLSELVGMGGHKEEAADALHAGPRLMRELSKPGSEVLSVLPPEIEAKIRLGEEPLAPYIYALLSKDVLVRYNARDAVSTAWLESVLEPQVADDDGLATIWREVVFPAARALVHVERWGIRVNQLAVLQFQSYLGTKIDAVRGRFDTLVGKDFNPNSSPQVSKLLFEKLRLPPKKLTDSGRFSTDKDVLEELQGKHPVVDDLLLWRRFTKLKGTYADGLLEHIRSDERIHPSYHVAGARSGRLSCSEPNLQNVPRAKDSPEGKMARDCFIASPGCDLLEGDYSQNELRVAAMLSGDPKMIGIFARGEDYHLRTAQLVSWQAWGIPPEQVTEVHRTQAKTFNFSSLFGAGDENLSGQLGITEEKIERIRNAIFGEFTVLASWIQKQIESARRLGYVRTFWNGKPARKRSLYQIADEGESYARGTAERGAYNSAIQGTAADFCTKSVADIVRWIIDDCFPAKLVLTVHDSIMLEVAKDFVAEAAENMKRIMEGQPTWNGVKLVVDFKRGAAWGSMEKYEIGKKAA
jgi:DNA polymerase I